MSDDLISRKAVIETVDKHTREDGILDDDISVILEEVNTAFDKKSVIEELKSLKEDERKYLTECGDKDSLRGMQCYERAIEIVEKGGIE